MDLPREATTRFRLPRRTLRLQLTLLYGGVLVVLLVAVLGIWGLLYGTSSKAAPGSPAGAVANAQAQAAGNGHHVDILFALVLAAAVVLALAIGWLIAGRLLRALRTITSTARDISASNLHERLNIEGPDDELKELGGTLDDLFARLEASFESQRRFVANASHELRTPLTAERSLLQVALADPDADVEAWRATGEELLALGELQERLIGALLTLARSERGIERRESLDLAAIAEKVVQARREKAERRGIRIETTFAAAPGAGDPGLVESLIANLVDNAIRHNVDSGQVEVLTGTRSGSAVLSVVNTGPVVAPEDVARLFEPFRKAGADRTRSNDGSGLGLSIVRAVVDAHGASIVVEPRSDGGLQVEVAFPASSRRESQAQEPALSGSLPA
jgi:signal transduction histidine kinase